MYFISTVFLEINFFLHFIILLNALLCTAMQNVKMQVTDLIKSSVRIMINFWELFKNIF